MRPSFAVAVPLLLSLVVVVAGAGCGGPDSLTGSIDQSHDLSFDSVGLTSRPMS